MDELEISGKRYISTRRAAREHGYHSDYMGQLIRGKKVIGQKVGRAWYIEESSLNAYLGKPPAPVVAPAAAVAEAPAPVPVERLVVEEPAPTAPEPQAVPVYAPAPALHSVEEIIIKEEAAQPIVQQAVHPVARETHHAVYAQERETRIPIHTQAPAVEEFGGLRYAADDAPSLPVITRMPQAPAYAPLPHEYAPAARHAASPFPYASLSIVAVVAVAAAVFASNFITATVVSQPGVAATVHYSIHW